MMNILYICTGNSCRSAIAEALTNHLGQGRFQAYSAGSQPVGFIHPKAIEIITRHQVSAEGLSSKSWDNFTKQHFDLIITVCDSAASETCPLFAGDFKRLHWSIPDPAAVTGSEEAINAAFDDVFNDIKGRIEDLLQGHDTV